MSTPRDTVDGPPCPKCWNLGQWFGPVYVPAVTTRTADRSQLAVVTYTDTVTPEHLQWTCPTCGWVRRQPCADAPTPTKT